ncbi:hypothetical protein SNE40_011394 [Patella caerulea]|uniref:Reverse transcriptase domain-containing protein n=1 Tax=Patella caerulea TaxID=87958 RepID=A0AAN8JNG3_PATCE
MFEEGNPVDCIFFDFKKALEMVSHGRLFAQVEMYGISGNVLTWVRNYLSNHTQIAINGRLYQPTAVPQGSIIGPILFPIIINDLHALAANFVKLFTDDTKLFGDASSQVRHPTRHPDIQQDIQTFADWTTKWCMKFHPDKCKVMRLGTGHHQYECTMNTQ